MGSDTERREVAFGYAWQHLNAAAKADQDGAAWAAAAWLQDRSAGQPYVALQSETARSDALFWAETASPVELECYMLAAADKLAASASLFHGKQIKRIVAALWSRMSEDERKGFLMWIKANHEAGK